MPDEVQGQEQQQQEQAPEAPEVEVGEKTYDELMAELEADGGEQPSDEQPAEPEADQAAAEEPKPDPSHEFAEKMRREQSNRRHMEQQKREMEALQAQVQQLQPLLQAINKSREVGDGGLSVLQALGHDPQDMIRSMLGQEKPAPTQEDIVGNLQQQMQQLQQQIQQSQLKAAESNYLGEYHKVIDGEAYAALRDYYAVSDADPDEDVRLVFNNQLKQTNRSLQPKEVADILVSAAEQRLADSEFRKQFNDRFERMKSFYEKLNGTTPQAASASAAKPTTQPSVRPSPAPNGGGDIFTGRGAVSEEEQIEALRKQYPELLG